jgi:hypothetical protein
MSEIMPGVQIAIGDRKYIVPPLTLGQIRRLAPELNRIGDRVSMLDGEVIGAIVKVVTAALQRNYPDLTEEAVEEMLDMANAPAVFLAVLTGSGLKRSIGPGEARLGEARLGEEGAAAPITQMADGTSSTASSPPPSAIAPATSTS